MIGKTNALNIVNGTADAQVTNYITINDTLANVYKAYTDGDTSAYFTPLKEQCDIWLNAGGGKVNFNPKPCVVSFTDNKMLLTKYSTMKYGNQYAHLYRFSGLLEGRDYYEMEIGILTAASTAETDNTNYEVADIYMDKFSFVDNNITVGDSSASTTGTINASDLAALDSNDHKLIGLGGEYYRKDEVSTSKHQLVYTCLTYDTIGTVIKFITVDSNTGA